LLVLWAEGNADFTLRRFQPMYFKPTSSQCGPPFSAGMAILVILFCCVGAAHGCQLFVGVNGSDRSAGTTAADPKQTIASAQISARKLAGPSTVCIGPGSFFLQNTLQLTAEDAGLTLKGSEAGESLLSAGRLVNGWQPSSTDPRLLVANISWINDSTLTGLDLSLYIGGERRERARLPSIPETYYTFVSPLVKCENPSAWSPTCPQRDAAGFVFQEDDLPNSTLYDLDSVEVSAVWAWTRSLSKIKQISRHNNTLLLKDPPSVGNRFGSLPGPSGSRYALENAREGLSPGAWYYDKLNRRLELFPRPSERANPASIRAVVGVLQSAVVISSGASDVHLENLAFCHSTGPTVLFDGASNSTLARSRVAHSQGVGVQITNSSGVTVEFANVSDTDLDGILADGPIDTTADPNRDIMIRDSVVSWTGRGPSAGQTFGIRLGGSARISAIHNDVSQGTYGGIGLGWQYGPPRSTFDWPIFNVSANHIHDYGRHTLSDFGGIYASGLCNFNNENVSDDKCMINALVESNVVHGATCYNYGCNGLYVDFWGGNVRFSKNVVYDVGDEAIALHCGMNNSASNNVLAGAQQCRSPSCSPHSYIYGCEAGQPGSSVVEKNVVVVEGNFSQPLFVPYAIYADWVFRQNAWYSTAGEALAFPNVAQNATNFSFAEWQATGQDAGSLAGVDPGFVDAAARDFRLKPDSPLHRLGIAEIDAAAAGPRPTPHAPQF